MGYDALKASYFGIPTVLKQNGQEISLANFTVKSGENRLARGKGGVGVAAVVESGAVRGGVVSGKKITFDTGSGKFVSP